VKCDVTHLGSHCVKEHNDGKEDDFHTFHLSPQQLAAFTRLAYETQRRIAREVQEETFARLGVR